MKKTLSYIRDNKISTINIVKQIFLNYIFLIFFCYKTKGYFFLSKTSFCVKLDDTWWDCCKEPDEQTDGKLMSCVSPVTASPRGGTKMLKVWKCWLKIGAHSGKFQISPSYIPSYSLYLCLCLLSALHLQSLLPVDSSMFLSVAECNWFCQSQSIDPRRAASAADSGGITVALAVATEMNLHFCICVFFWKRKQSWCYDCLIRSHGKRIKTQSIFY